MTDDKALVDAYSSIYKKKEEIKEEVQQLDEALPLAIPALIKGAGLAMKALKIGRKVHQGVQVAKGLVNTMKGDKQMQTAGHEPEGEMIDEKKSDWRQELDEKCWPGYEKKGMKTMFGKRYPNCVKKSKKKK